MQLRRRGQWRENNALLSFLKDWAQEVSKGLEKMEGSWHREFERAVNRTFAHR